MSIIRHAPSVKHKKNRNFMNSFKIVLMTLIALYSSACSNEQKEDEIMTRNKLSEETSPYLLQHAGNPVHWYAWGDEAFELARSLDKPIFLSIGYSSCHWCHVMEEESFEDPEVAQLLNSAFVCVKVDREERPDIDAVYMRYAMAMNGRGGWPLTIIMRPDGNPFFAATYIPKHPSRGGAGLTDLIPAVTSEWVNNREAIDSVADRIAGITSSSSNPTTFDGIPSGSVADCYNSFSNSYDSTYGGFGRAPKFPSPHSILFLLRYWKSTGDSNALEMAAETMKAIRAGGVYDQLAFGLHRYSTDREWLVPHFEKMLYDQAMFVLASLELYEATGDAVFSEMASSTIEYVLRDMTSPEGVFYSSEDADSGEGEGEFYVWTVDETNEILSQELASKTSSYWNMTEDGNFAEHGQETEGRCILHTSPDSLQEIDSVDWLREVRVKLLSVRNNRPRPSRDDKILTDWNGLMIASLARAAVVLNRPELLEIAENAFTFILDEIAHEENKLVHSWISNTTGPGGFLDDYAFMIRASLELYRATFNIKYLEQAIALQGELDAHFATPDGAYYLTSDYGDDRVPRITESYDGAIPSGNSISLWNLNELWRLTGNPGFKESAVSIENFFSNSVATSPSGHSMMLSAILFSDTTVEIVIKGSIENPVVQKMLTLAADGYTPGRTILLVENNDQIPAWIPEGFEDFTAAAYVCFNGACQLPVTSSIEFEKLLNSID